MSGNHKQTKTRVFLVDDHASMREHLGVMLQAKLLSIWLVLVAWLLVCRGTAVAYDWLPPTNKIVVLAVSAHPDDEGIFFGGALPYYSAVLNLPTMLVCMADQYDTVREDELRCAAWSYGLRYEPILGHFDYRNTGTITNSAYGTNTLDLCWDVWADGTYHGTASAVEAGKARAINFVAEQIRRYRPDVVITHDLNGETGHDNHRATAYAVTHAFYVAADPNATATNLVGLPPWQAQKLYVHLYATNRLFHQSWETSYPALTNQTPHQAVNQGLTCHVSQGPLRWSCSSVYPPASSLYSPWPSEWWGLYASMVGPDTVLSSNTILKGYTVPAGVAAGDFLEHLAINGLFFTAVPQPATVPAGSPVSLSAAAVATTPPLGYQWKFNGASIAGATGASLTLSNAKPADAGSYTVMVTNSAGAITSPPALLTVLVPPVIISTPQTQTNLAGTLARFSATASGSGPLSYQWLLNGIALHDDGNIQGATATDLQIANVQPADAGSFVLKVSNPAGATLAPVATLVVEVPPPCLGNSPGLVGWWPGDGDASDIAAGNNGALLGAASASAAGKVAQAFGFDGINSLVQIPDSPLLKPANLTVEAWVRFNALDSAASGGSPPGQQFIVFKQNSRTSYFEGYSLTKVRTAGGDVFSFTVSSASGQPVGIQSATHLATGVWYHVAAERGPNFIQLYVNGQLESEASVGFPQDYGTNALCFGSSGQTYWDHKFNGVLDEVTLYSRALTGSEIASIYAAGAAGKCREAAVSVQPGSQTAFIGSNTVFTAAASGPGLTYQWFFNGTNALAAATNSVLLLTNVGLAQSGAYSVLVSNFVGAVLSQPAVLQVTALPGIIMPLKLSGTVGSTWRIDYANDLLRPGNWTMLATVTLTNTSQIYLDGSALTQPRRFYRVVPLP